VLFRFKKLALHLRANINSWNLNIYYPDSAAKEQK
jgi:hypothetical protein